MPRKKGSNGNFAERNGNGNHASMRGDAIRWVNIKLSDEDVFALEQSSATLEFLAADLMAICCWGISVSIRYVDDGKSVCVTLIRSDLGDGGGNIGMSSFGGSIRDALLCAVYKYRVCLEGSFHNADAFLSDTEQRRRFR